MTIVTALTQAKAHAKSSDPDTAFLQCQQTANRTHTRAAVASFATKDGRNTCRIDGSAPYVGYSRTAVRNLPIQCGETASAAMTNAVRVPAKLYSRRFRCRHRPSDQS